MAGGLLTALINIFLTPLLPHNASPANSVILWRAGASAAAAALLLLGTVGLYLRQARVGTYAGGIAFAGAFLGCALIFAWEWTNVFVLPVLATRAPGALKLLESAPSPSPYDLGAMGAVTLFAIGWLAFAAWTLRSAVLSRPAAALVIAGLLLTPSLSAVLPGAWGGAVGNAILGAGWLWLGWDVRSVTQ